MESYKSQKKIIHFSSKFKLKQKEKSLRQLDQKKREISKSLTNVVGQLKNFQEKEKVLSIFECKSKSNRIKEIGKRKIF